MYLKIKCDCILLVLLVFRIFKCSIYSKVYNFSFQIFLEFTNREIKFREFFKIWWIAKLISAKYDNFDHVDREIKFRENFFP